MATSIATGVATAIHNVAVKGKLILLLAGGGFICLMIVPTPGEIRVPSTLLRIPCEKLETPIAKVEDVPRRIAIGIRVGLKDHIGHVSPAATPQVRAIQKSQYRMALSVAIVAIFV